jgi:hypothetical protein
MSIIIDWNSRLPKTKKVIGEHRCGGGYKGRLVLMKFHRSNKYGVFCDHCGKEIPLHKCMRIKKKPKKPKTKAICRLCKRPLPKKKVKVREKQSPKKKHTKKKNALKRIKRKK